MRELTDILQLVQLHLFEILAFAVPAAVALASSLLAPFVFAAAAAQVMPPDALHAAMSLVFVAMACCMVVVEADSHARSGRRPLQPGGASSGNGAHGEASTPSVR